MRRIRKHLTATTAAIASALVMIAGGLGIDFSPQLAVSVVFLLSAAVSYFFPRWAGARGLDVRAHPAAFTAALSLIAVWAAPLLGADLDREQAVSIVGGLTTLIGIGTPRQET